MGEETLALRLEIRGGPAGDGSAMPRVTVLIPTAARPETLEITLRGVARQTAVAQIAEIVVSENLGDPRSRAVCEMFPELPITYRLREPRLGNMMQHAAHLFGEVGTELVAFVCDDDIWAPGHLQSAMDSLDRHPSASAHFSGFISAESELSSSGTFWAPPLFWLAGGQPPRWSEYVYGLQEVLALSWILTPFQWSTLVARQPAVAAAAPALTDSPHLFYADRMLIVALAHQGSLIFDPAVDTLYRVYEGNWARGQDPAVLRELLSECASLIVADAQAEGVDLAGVWRRLLAETPPNLLADVAPYFHGRFTTAELEEHGFAQFLPPRNITTRAFGRLRRAGDALAGRTR